MQHSITDSTIVLEQVGTLVLSHGHQTVDSLIDKLEGMAPIYSIGDCLASRTTEEAVLDGFRVGVEV
jgi:hypothetical protein